MNSLNESTIFFGRKMESDQSGKSNPGSDESDREFSKENDESVRELGHYREFLQRQMRTLSTPYQARIEASDIVQQTLMEAYEKLEQFRGKSKPEMAKWLSKMLQHNVADAVRALRRKKRDVARERSLDNASSPSAMGPADWLASDQTTPSLRASNSEEAKKLWQAIQALPDAQRDVVILHHLNGKSLSEVAQSTNRTSSSVAGLLYRGLKSLRESMKKS